MTTVWDCSKMNRVALLIAAFLLLALVSCGRHGTVGVSNRKELKLNLSKAETLIGTDDSLALAMLSDINPKTIKNPKLFSQYALLYGVFATQKGVFIFPSAWHRYVCQSVS